MATFINITKNISTFVNSVSSGIAYFITTDTPDYVLVGDGQTEFLVWQEATTFTNLPKN